MLVIEFCSQGGVATDEAGRGGVRDIKIDSKGRSGGGGGRGNGGDVMLMEGLFLVG
jgi:hypothetical protein